MGLKDFISDVLGLRSFSNAEMYDRARAATLEIVAGRLADSEALLADDKTAYVLLRDQDFMRGYEKGVNIGLGDYARLLGVEHRPIEISSTDSGYKFS